MDAALKPLIDSCDGLLQSLNDVSTSSPGSSALVPERFWQDFGTNAVAVNAAVAAFTLSATKQPVSVEEMVGTGKKVSHALIALVLSSFTLPASFGRTLHALVVRNLRSIIEGVKKMATLALTTNFDDRQRMSIAGAIFEACDSFKSSLDNKLAITQSMAQSLDYLKDAERDLSSSNHDLDEEDEDEDDDSGVLDAAAHALLIILVFAGTALHGAVKLSDFDANSAGAADEVAYHLNVIASSCDDVAPAVMGYSCDDEEVQAITSALTAIQSSYVAVYHAASSFFPSDALPSVDEVSALIDNVRKALEL